MKRRVLSALIGVLLLTTGAATLQVGSASAAKRVTAKVAQDRVVSAVPASNTPNVASAGSVRSFAQVGNKIIVGGKFTSVTQTKTAPAIVRNHLFAYDATTGAIDTGFVPVVDGEVDALMAGTDGQSVYVGGYFTHVNGFAHHGLTKLNTSTGAEVAGFQVPRLDGNVTDFVLAGSRLYVAGQFTKAAAIPHAGMVAVDATNGAVDPYMSVQFTGHHNWQGGPKNGYARPGVWAFDVTPDRTKLIAIGNFKYVNGLDRDQAVMLDLGAGGAVVANWHTDQYKPACASSILDAWVRDVGFSPDGSYFAIVTTGAPFAGTLCDTAARWETAATGTSLQPTWVNYTGGDTLLTVAMTGAAIYVGGHQRWLNNPFAGDSALAGAVPRPGIAALDPANGLPLSWNPGRNPRGYGTTAMLVTPSGLFVGSDTFFIGNRRYYHGKFAFFPLAGGKVTPPTTTANLPGTVYQGGKLTCATCPSDQILARPYSGGTAGAATAMADPGFGWSAVRGAVLINGVLYFGLSNGYFYQRPFNGTTFGTSTYVDPYNDAQWSNVQAGRGIYYRGAIPNFYGAEIANISSMWFSNGRLYYTFIGQAGLYYRYFTPESNIIGATRFQVADGQNYADVAGAFLASNNLYVASRSNGHLYKAPWANGQISGAFALVSGPTIDGQDWRAQAMFVR